MSNTSFKGQLQVVEGNSLSEFHITPRFDYGSSSELVYYAESKLERPDNDNCYYIQKFLYDSSLNLISIKTASNITQCNCTNITILVTNPIPKIVKITINGDFLEANVNDGFEVITPTQSFSGKITQVISTTEILVLVDNDNPAIVNEVGTVITTDKLTIQLNSDKTKDYTKRRWSNRARYLYI